jgi:hypothetical protein
MGMAAAEVLLEHFKGGHCKQRIGPKVYEKGHPGIVLGDRLVEAGLAVRAIGEQDIRSLVSQGLIAPCGYDVCGERHHGYIFGMAPDANEKWGQVLEEAETPLGN